ncbi:Aspartate-semialdehyde dehydrogenase [Stutzerimonas kunmingensis]|uniref:aspartate-semialdehyde dehydrogenase n=1 Tax=Stutzerimonas kunmingensis TaxID=1211807 RepID=UPI0008E28AB7|nr:aspartate-semialdehyde dehydrogenase [Stutzerimonas kunmingensis]MCQ2041589.1 aspartate-semialdehyde dehydrogenase [Stutzerimonas kunmingensis]SFJ04838.1 Aspartate-semialdehyde dehydrogenase [Stutzerimonas kunmingensis]
MATGVGVAVVGAVSLVGEALVEVLEERAFPVSELHLLDDSEGAGHTVPFKGRNLRVGEADRFDFNRAQLVFLVGASELVSECHVKAVAAGCRIVDLSGTIPVKQQLCVVPEVNGVLLDSLPERHAVASPLPEAVVLAIALKPIRQQLDLHRVTVTACLPVSSRGSAGVKELARQTSELLNARPLEPRIFGRQMAFNMLAQAEAVDAQGYGAQERRLVEELRQLLDMPELAVSVTFVQAPVFFGESLIVSLQGGVEADMPALSAALDAAQGVELVESDDYPTAVGDAVGQEAIYVGRLRRGICDPWEVNLWIVSDNVRKGAALNAVQSGELLIKDYL